jgi:hypothetical protein
LQAACIEVAERLRGTPLPFVERPSIEEWGHNEPVGTSKVGSQSHRSPLAAGYLIAVAINAALWVVINVRPGWASFDFLAPSFSEVLPLVNLSLIVGMLVNAGYVVILQPWFKHLGRTIVAVIGVVVSWRLLVVYPFDVSIGWDALIRSILILALLGSSIGALVEFVRLVRGDRY